MWLPLPGRIKKPAFRNIALSSRIFFGMFHTGQEALPALCIALVYPVTIAQEKSVFLAPLPRSLDSCQHALMLDTFKLHCSDMFPDVGVCRLE